MGTVSLCAAFKQAHKTIERPGMHERFVVLCMIQTIVSRRMPCVVVEALVRVRDQSVAVLCQVLLLFVHVVVGQRYGVWSAGLAAVNV